ncbi:hypothetical protein BDN72DRAFT_962350 [Pluteus cervinus]|uniref:Uncharacterized protein n=1 Tax=Pluteus cervinus TaxID=181527 RepID=A0ACD3AJN2_9AGAR|nr:hypothetical protein BDN72DRAFT_962350 [Pluteus cervinus]
MHQTSPYIPEAREISEIFVLVQADRDRGASMIDLWLQVTHVSQHWRKVALECVELWCQIGSLPEAAIREFLVRSGGRSLSVNLIDMDGSMRPRYYSDALLADVFAQTFRIQSLSFEGAEHFNRVLPHLSSKPALKLATLRISGFDVGDSVDIPDDIVLFQGNTPQLSALFLNSCRILPSSRLFANDLTTLDVRGRYNGSTITWLKIIQQMPRLSHLTLIDAFTDEIQDEYTPIPQDFVAVPLLQLSQLCIRGCRFKSDLEFLAHLTFPAQTTFKFSSDTDSIIPQSAAPVPPLISFLRVYNQSCLGLQATEITSITLDEPLVQIPLVFDQLSLRFSASGASQTYLDIVLHSSRAVDCDEMLVAELTSLPTSHLTSLTICCNVSYGTMRVLSDRLPHLQEISCSGKAIEPFLMALGAKSADFYNPEEGTSTYWGRSTEQPRQLEVALMENIEGPNQVGDPVLANPTPDLSQSPPPPSFVFLETVHLYATSLDRFSTALVSALSARQKIGLPVKKVRFSQIAKISDVLLSRLRSLVDDVQYDECTPEPEDCDIQAADLDNTSDDFIQG